MIKSATFLQRTSLFSEMRPILHDGFGAAAVCPDFNFERSCSLVFQQVFHVQRFNATFRYRLGSDSAQDSDTVACAQEVAVSGRTGQEQPRATGQRQCVHAQKGQNARREQPGKAPKPAQEPSSVGPHDTWAHSVEQPGTTKSGW